MRTFARLKKAREFGQLKFNLLKPNGLGLFPAGWSKGNADMIRTFSGGQIWPNWPLYLVHFPKQIDLSASLNLTHYRGKSPIFRISGFPASEAQHSFRADQ